MAAAGSDACALSLPGLRDHVDGREAITSTSRSQRLSAAETAAYRRRQLGEDGKRGRYGGSEIRRGSVCSVTSFTNVGVSGQWSPPWSIPCDLQN